MTQLKTHQSPFFLPSKLRIPQSGGPDGRPPCQIGTFPPATPTNHVVRDVRGGDALDGAGRPPNASRSLCAARSPDGAGRLPQ